MASYLYLIQSTEFGYFLDSTAYCPIETRVGMITDIRINPDNKLPGNIRIINYPFNYPSTWRLILFMNFFV